MAQKPESATEPAAAEPTETEPAVKKATTSVLMGSDDTGYVVQRLKGGKVTGSESFADKVEALEAMKEG